MHFYHTLSFHLQKPLESLVEDVSINKCKNEKAWSLYYLEMNFLKTAQPIYDCKKSKK